ncbi:hypothetical protein [Mycoplasmopsis arginini]|uniref:hypothetical protein n=1 Tax=Mycoplasmopsis arginini TaxID=2094 RepID=UPI00249DA732|nr:hypothetical protein [Mycoplasmopsis arginini]MDI3350476.1 hypothetical protein [Mycoplasmopsis arginini]MDI3350812.1 hypothetical protein [Mycoplasmopsis arginini]
MLKYGKNIALLKPLPELKKPEPSAIVRFFRHFLDFLGDVVISIIEKVVNFATLGIKIVGDLVEIALGAIKDIFINVIFGEKIDWKQIGINTLWRLGTTGYVYAGRKFVKFIKNLSPKASNVLNWFRKTGKSVWNLVKNPSNIPRYLLNKTVYFFTKKMNKSPIFKKLDLKKIRKVIRGIIRHSIGLSVFIKGMINSKNKTDFAIRRGINFLKFGQKRIIKKLFQRNARKNILSLARNNNQSVKSYERVLKKADLTWIPFKDSNWIDGVKIASTSWIENENDSKISFYTFFNSEVKKPPLLFIDRPIDEFNGFITAASKGKFYLDNFAWGWEIGKAIKLQEKEQKNTKTYFWIKNLSSKNSKYNKHFLSSISSIEENQEAALEAFRNNFKVLSSTKNRFLGNKMVVQFDNEKIRFYKKMTKSIYNKTLLNNKTIKKTSKIINLKIKPKRL